MFLEAPAVMRAVVTRSHWAGKAVFVNAAHRSTCHSFLCKRAEPELPQPEFPRDFLLNLPFL